MIRLRHINKNNYCKLQIKTQNTIYGLKLKSKKIDAKLRSNKHRTTIRHNNKIVFTRQSTIGALSNK